VAKRPRRPRGPTDIRWILTPILDGKEPDAVILSRARSAIRDFLGRVEGFGREALDIRPHPFWRVYAEQAEKALAIVRKARADDPFKAFSLELWEATLVLTELGARAHKIKVNRFRTAKAIAKRKQTKAPGVKARRELIQKLCKDANVPIDAPGITDWLAGETNRSPTTMKTDLKAIWAELSLLPKKRRTPTKK
jgi:hypothetical protein